MGFIPVQAGRVLLDGEDITRRKATDRAGLGMALVRSNEAAKGLPQLELAISLQPKNPKYLCDFGIAALRAGWLEKSFAACQAQR